MLEGAEEGTFTICAHSSLPQSAGELCKINVTTYPCKLPKPNPEAASIYSVSIMRCFMLKRNIKHVFMASLDHWQEKKKGNIQESLICCTHTGTLPQETGLPKSLTLPCLSWDYRGVGTGHKEERTNSYCVISPANLDFLTSRASQLTQLLCLLFCVSFCFLYAGLLWNCPAPPPLHQEASPSSGSLHFFPSSQRALKSSSYGKQDKVVRSGAPQGCCLESPSILKVDGYTYRAQDKAGPQLGLYDGWRWTHRHESLGVPLN